MFQKLFICLFWEKKKDNFPVDFNNETVKWLYKPQNCNTA